MYPQGLGGIKSKEIGNTWVLYDKKGNVIATFDGDNRTIVIPSGSSITGAGGDGAAWATDSAVVFSGSGSMTWTGVTVTQNRYVQIGKTMFHAFKLGPYTVGGTPAIDLRMTIPNSKVANGNCDFVLNALENSVFIPAIQGFVQSGQNFLSFRKGPGTTWGNFSNGFMSATAVYEVQ